MKLTHFLDPASAAQCDGDRPPAVALFAEYAARPALLRERYGTTQRGVIVIDEIQKLPALLDEVHWLIENTRTSFLLTGSSARTLRRGHAHLLAGRAWRRMMVPLCGAEVGGFDLENRRRRSRTPQLGRCFRRHTRSKLAAPV